ncbi:hypothetical protein ABFY59_30280 [Priestia aryabhattai]|uniref:hypothetical protein n=1 Tax=Priestia aryabhattai TaxID=412384 RepID=UPI003D2E5C27
MSHEVDRYEKENKALKHDLSETRQELAIYVGASRWPRKESQETNAPEACP